MIKQLSTNGYQLSDVFEPEHLAVLTKQIDTFIPDFIQPHPDGRREKLAILDIGDPTNIRPTVTELILQITPNLRYISSIELWRDYPGYTNSDHIDSSEIENIMILYFDTGDNILGTRWFDPDEYSVPYKANSGLLLLNSDKILHGLCGAVSGVKYRKAMYINWKTIRG
jgi:hypothetical protein